MLRSTLLLAVAALATAQDSASITSSGDPSASTAASSSSSEPVTHTVAVAKGGHTFVPDVTLAEVGDVIEFQFYPTNHSVIRAEYQYPCIPYEDTGVNKFGFFSGFKPVDAILPDPPTFYLTINDTDPVFYYCGAPGSCINYQMVGVINPNASTSLVTQKELAKESTYMLVPGESVPSEEENPSSATTSSASSSASATSASASQTSAAASSSHHSSLSAGAIAGITIGATAVALGAAVALFLCGRQSRTQRQNGALMHHQQNMPFIPPSMAGSQHPGHMSYASHPGSMNKHMSMHSNFQPALPGYAPSQHDSAIPSPPMHPTYTQSDALNPGYAGTETTSPAHSPGVGVAVPAYHPGHMSMQSNQTQSSIFGAPAPRPNVHEMAAPVSYTGVHHVQQPVSPEPQSAGSGIMGFLGRKSSISKAGGVERYS